MSKLHSMLSTSLGAEYTRIIAGGVDIAAAGDKSLADAGIQQSGVLQACPRFRPDSDIDKAFARAGPVEQAILAHHTAIEAFLDGPYLPAEKAYIFLRHVRLPRETRLSVAATAARAEDLFPLSKPFRTRFSLFVLKTHARDLGRAAIVDRDFSRRAILLLTSIVLDETVGGSRIIETRPILEVLIALQYFLSESPSEGHMKPYFQEPISFVERMCTLLVEASQLSPHKRSATNSNIPLRTEYAALIYQVLLQACHTDEALWEAVVGQEDVVANVHHLLLFDDDMFFSERIATQIKTACLEPGSTRMLPHFYWRLLFPHLSTALQHPTQSRCYFSLLVEILKAHRTLQDDESAVQGVTDTLLSFLNDYEHNEQPALLLRDEGMVGLLELLVTTVKWLKKFRKRMGLGDLPTRLVQNLLFPSPDASHVRPLVHMDSRSLVFDLLRCSYTVETDYMALVSATYGAITPLREEATARFPGFQEWLRFGSYSAGLSNLGMTCYMNSLLQQLFANLQFRKFILDEPVVDAQRQMVLAGLQTLFAKMQNDLEPVANTTDLASILSIQIGVQEDVHTFYTTLLSQLEDNMPNQEKKAALTHFFTGKSVTQIRGECGHVSAQSETFTELSLTVKNKANLYESLAEFVQGEPLQGANKYMCMTCATGDSGKLVNAMRRTCLDKVPDSLTFCLKRFAFDNMHEGENKVNDRFEFPPKVDMSLYKRGHLEDSTALYDPDDFELVGVIVHQGSLSFGHYWSYVRVAGLPVDDPNGWLYVEDTKTYRCGGLKEVQEQCFGGLTWTDGSERPESGYVLFYQRSSYIAQASEVNTTSRMLTHLHGILPRVDLPVDLAEHINKDNLWRMRVAGLFDERFSSFVLWLLGQFPSVVEAQAALTEGSDTSDSMECGEQMADSALDVQMGQLVSCFALRVICNDPTAEAKLDSLRAGLEAVLKARPTVALHILKPFYEWIDQKDGQPDERNGFVFVARNRNWKVRTALLDMVLACLTCLRNNDTDDYDQVLHDIVTQHRKVTTSVIGPLPQRWEAFLEFASALARQGAKEAEEILEAGHCLWALHIISLPLEVERRKEPGFEKIWTAVKHGNVDFSPLFAFVFNILNEHVDLSLATDDVIGATKHSRISTPNGVSLKEVELMSLFRTPQGRAHPMWSLYYTACRYCAASDAWRDFAPAKLVALLATQPSLADLVNSNLLYHFNVEDRELQPLLVTTLHYVKNVDDKDCGQVMNTLCKNLVLWAQEKRSIWFLREAYAMAPISVVDSIQIWALCNGSFLVHKAASTRQATANAIIDFVFKPEPLSDNTQLDASRIRITRFLLKHCVPVIENAYRRELPRGDWEAMISAMKEAKEYLARLRTSILALQTIDQSTAAGQKPDSIDESTSSTSPSAAPAGSISSALRLVPMQVKIEYGETAALVNALNTLLDEIEDWESAETALPTRTAGSGIRKSLESNGGEGEVFQSTAWMEDIDDSDADYADCDSEEDELA